MLGFQKYATGSDRSQTPGLDESREPHSLVSRAPLSHGCESELRAWDDCRCSSISKASVSTIETLVPVAIRQFRAGAIGHQGGAARRPTRVSSPLTGHPVAMLRPTVSITSVHARGAWWRFLRECRSRSPRRANAAPAGQAAAICGWSLVGGFSCRPRRGATRLAWPGRVRARLRRRGPGVARRAGA
jgi:hypothetical protein